MLTFPEAARGLTLLSKGIIKELRASKQSTKLITEQQKIEDLAVDLGEADEVIDLLTSFSARLDRLGLTDLKGKMTSLDEATQLKFANDFADASDDVLRQIGANDSNLIVAWQKLDELEQNIFKTNPAWLKRVNDWDGAGVQLSKNGNNLKLSDASGSTLGEFKNGNLLPEKYAKTGTPVGDVVNGYQIVDNGGALKRTPDISGYDADDLIKLTEHPDAHVLERHSHDVTDDALQKRATRGVAPDGSTTASGNPPPYSSKFESDNRLKDALNNTGPGSSDWNPPSSGNTYAFDYPSSGTASTPFGYGIPSGGGSAVPMNRVKVVYKKNGGVWKLLTMFPQP